MATKSKNSTAKEREAIREKKIAILTAMQQLKKTVDEDKKKK